jgi:hypothetical protein
MLTGRLPFLGNNDAQTMMIILEEEFPQVEDIGPEIQSLLQGLLTKDH